MLSGGGSPCAIRMTVDACGPKRQISVMDRQTALDRLRRERPALQALGLKGVSLFGSTARGEAVETSDLDLAVTLDETHHIDLFRFAAMSERVSRLLGTPVDMVVEPTRNPRMQAEIDRDRVRAY